MVSSIVGDYLIKKGLITKEQFKDFLNEQQKVRVKLGLIAVAEGLMTQEEADKVNQLQTVMDKRFGDIAVEKGYLTEGQVNSLLKKQGNAYLAFAQALENQQLMTVEQLEQYLLDYRFENHLTASDMDDIKSDDVDRILPIFLPIESDKYIGMAGTAVRTLMRCVDSEVYPGKAVIVSNVAADNAAIQKMEGSPSVTCGMAGSGDGLLYAASVFGQEEFPEVNEDALDAIGELLNCINGLYASSVSKEGTSLELLPPEFKTGIKEVSGKEMLVLPVYMNGSCLNFLVSVDDDIEIK